MRTHIGKYDHVYLCSIHNKNVHESATRTKFLLAVRYGSPRRDSNSYKTFEKNRIKLICICVTISGLAESFKTMNRPNLTVTLFDGLFLGEYKR